MTRAGDELGARGEEEAARALQRAGLTILARNVRLAQGELDLVARDGEELVFVEVKARTIGPGGVADCEQWAQESVTWQGRKLGRIATAGEAWALANDFERAPWRIDLVVVCLDRDGRLVRLEHFRDIMF